MNPIKTKNLLLFLLLIACNQAFAQAPSVSYLNNPMGNNEEYPILYPKPNGGFILTNNLTKTSPDSSFGSVTFLNSSFNPQWSRVFKLRTKTSITSLLQEANGQFSFLLNGYTTSSRYYPCLVTLDQNGETVSVSEVVDSSSATQSSPFFLQVKLGNGNRILVSSSASELMRINAASGKVDFSRQYRFKNQSNQILVVQAAAAVEGTNQWVATGKITNTNLSFMLRMNDTTLVNFHVYNFDPVSSISNGVSNVKILPNQDIQMGWVDNSQRLHLARTTNTGSILWWKAYKIPLTYPGKMTVVSSGDIYMTGSITPGQAGGIIARFSPTGELISKKGQFKLGFSHSNMSALAELPNNELLTMQKAYYEQKSVTMVNRIHNTLDFVCFDSNVGNFIDTTYTIFDSVSTQISFVKKRFGLKTALSFPLMTYGVTTTTGDVICTPTAVNESIAAEKFDVYPNPTNGLIKIDGLERHALVQILATDGRMVLSTRYSEGISVQSLPSGIYILAVPELNIRKRFVKE